MKILSLTLLLSFLSLPAFSAVKSDGKQKFKPMTVLADGSLDENSPGTEDYEKFVAAWKLKHPSALTEAAESHPDKRRNPASGENLIQKVSPGLEKMRNKIQSLSTGDEFAAYLETVKSEYATYTDEEVKIVANELIELSNLRGIIFRMVPLVKNRNMDHSMLLTFFMRMADSLSFYRPYPQWKAAFEFLTQPYDNVVQFQSIKDFQRFVGSVLYPASQDSIDRLNAIHVGSYLIWDNTILTGKNMIPDNYDRYSYIQFAEKEILLAAKYRGLANMDLFRAYNFDDLFNISKDISHLYVGDSLGGLFTGEVQGVSPKDLTDKVRAYKNFGRLYKNGGSLTSDALKNFQQMTLHLVRAWDDLEHNKGKNDRPEHLVLNRGLADLYTRNLDKTIPTWNAMVNQKTTLTSRVVIEAKGDLKNKVVVDVPAFFTHPVSDLKSLFPVQFEDNSKNAVWSTKKDVKMGGRVTDIQYHNYLRGAGKAWSHKAYQWFYPEFETLKSPDKDVAEESVKSNQRVLMQSWGGSLVSFPLSLFMF